MPEIVIKIGGSLLGDIEQLDTALAAITRAAPSTRFLIVPGGGVFADVVRDVDRRIGIPDDAAHWMAILAMDQYAHLLAARVPAGAVVTTSDDARRTLDEHRIPFLAPSRWLSDADPLPHSWDVTSDSIAAWVAGAVRARELMLVKASGAGGTRLVDAYFPQAVPSQIVPAIVWADKLAEALDSRASRVSRLS